MIIGRKIVGIILGVSILGFFGLLTKEYFLLEKEINTFLGKQISEVSVVDQVNKEKVIYIIDKGDGEPKEYQTILTKGATVFSLLKKLAQNENFKVESKVYPEMGVFVESIEGVKNGDNGRYWQYWVNGELPMVASDKKEIKGGDKIEWRFAPTPF